MVGFVLLDLCIFQLLFMVLRHLFLHLIACASFVLPFAGWFGLAVSPWLMLVLFLAFWMVPLVVILPFCVVWFRFRLLRRYLALWPAEVGRVYRLLEMVGDGCPGHRVLFTFFVVSAARIGFQWDPVALAWIRPGLPMLSHIAGPIQHFRSAILDAWRNKVAADLCGRKGFRGGPLLDIHGSLQLLNSSHVRERDRVSGMVSCSVVFVITLFLAGSVVRLIMMVICFGNVPFHPLWRFVKILNFTTS